MGIAKIAILILAHKNQDQLNKLVDHLKTDFSIYIHIDSKSIIKINNESNVQVIKKFRVYWGCFSQILATRELMKIAAYNKHDRYLLISGQDLPIKSNQEIISFFENNKNNYVEKIELPSSWWTNHPQGGLQKVRYYHFNYFNRRGKKIYEKIIRLIERKLHQMQDNFMFHRKIPENLFGGSNWFNLTHEAIMVCLEELYDRKNIKLYKYAKNGDELIINTIIYNSRLVYSCINNDLRYTNMNYTEEPRNIIKMEDYEKFNLSKQLFARKFDDKVNKDLIDKVYEMIT